MYFNKLVVAIRVTLHWKITYNLFLIIFSAKFQHPEISIYISWFGSRKIRAKISPRTFQRLSNISLFSDSRNDLHGGVNIPILVNEMTEFVVLLPLPWDSGNINGLQSRAYYCVLLRYNHRDVASFDCGIQVRRYDNLHWHWFVNHTRGVQLRGWCCWITEYIETRHT